MEIWGKMFPDKESLRSYLEFIKHVGNKNEGKDRAKLIGDLLDAIVDKQCDWNRDQRTKCYKQLIKHYIDDDNIDLILAICAFDEPYSRKRTLLDRRELFKRENYDYPHSAEPKALEQREKKAIEYMASSMYYDYQDNPDDIYNIVMSALNVNELVKLGLKSPDQSAGVLETQAPQEIYNRHEKIINIVPPEDDMFVGRFSILKAIQKGFTDGEKVLLIGGCEGRGKTRLALEYVRIHAEEYQIICWIDASNIISNVISFFDIAKVNYNSISLDSISTLFCSFFENNKDWLIIFDAPELISSVQLERLRKFIPKSKGNIIITSQIGIGVDDFKFLLLDNFNDSGDTDDDILFIKKVLNKQSLDGTDLKLRTLCEAEPIALTLTTSCIRNYLDSDCETYLKILEYFGVSFQELFGALISEIAFDILVHKIELIDICLGDDLNKAILQLLILFSIYNSVDLLFLSFSFPILPEPLYSLCRNDISRKELVKAIKIFGLYEINPNIIQGNTMIKRIIYEHFRSVAKNYIFGSMIKKADQEIFNAKNNSFFSDYKVLVHTEKYVIPLLDYFSIEDNADKDLKTKYPNIFDFLSQLLI